MTLISQDPLFTQFTQTWDKTHPEPGLGKWLGAGRGFDLTKLDQWYKDQTDAFKAQYGHDPTYTVTGPPDATAGVHRMPGTTIGRAPTAPPAATTTPTTPPPASTPPPGNTTQPNPNSSLLAALQTVIDSLGNYAPTQNPTDPLGVSPDYSFNANPNQDWSAYVNMLGYNRV